MGKRILVLSLALAYILLLSAWLSSKNLMVIDEFFAWNLLADPSFHHALGSWNAGADSGGLLFYTLLWPVVHLTHGSVLAARLVSAVAYVLAGVVWWRALARFLPSSCAALGVLVAWLSSTLLISYVAQVRFYTLLLLFASMAVWTTLRSLEDDVSPLRAGLLVFGAHACLVLIHMLGVVYSALILGACLLAGAPHRRARRSAFAGAASWLLLLPCRAAIHNGSVNATSLYQPRLWDLLRYYLKFSAVRPVLLLAFLGLCWLVRDFFLPRVPALRRKASPRLRSTLLCLAFFPAPLVLFLLSISTRPLGALRYLLPYTLSLCTLCAYALTRLQEAAPPRRVNHLSAAVLLLALTLHLSALTHLITGPRLELGGLEHLATGQPILVADEQTFFELQYYASTPARQFHFLLPPTGEHSTGMMSTIAQRGYFPNSLHPADTYLQTHPDFLYIANSPHDPNPWVTRDPTCHAHPVGFIRIGGLPDAVYSVTGCRPPV